MFTKTNATPRPPKRLPAPPRCRGCQSDYAEFWDVLRAAPSLALRQAEGLCPECLSRAARASRRLAREGP